jgi:hypothetical protein
MAEIMAPTQKNKSAISIIGRRPKIFEKEAKLGWNTGECKKSL